MSLSDSPPAPPPPPHPMRENNGSILENPKMFSVDDTAIGLYSDQFSNSPQNFRKVQSFSAQNSTRKSMDDSIFADPRMNRIAMAELATRQEMFKECTFRPQIKPLPRSYGALKDLDTPFYERVTKWKTTKDSELKIKGQSQSKAEVTECTFKPMINKNSIRSVKETRGNVSDSEDVNSRLYKDYMAYIEQRQRLIESERIKEEASEESKCTFKPQIYTKKSEYYSRAASKYDKGPVEKFYEPPRSETKNCTFTPKVNKIKPNMSSAKLYLSTDVVNRLTRPLSNQAQSNNDSLMQTFDTSFTNNERPIIDLASFMANNNAGNKSNRSSFTTPNPTGKKSRPVSAPHTRRSKEIGSAINGESEQKFDSENKKMPKDHDSFYLRQQAILKKREEKIKQMETTMTPKFKPKITPKAKVLQKKTQGPSFLERAEMDIKKRLSIEQSHQIVHDDDCTFKPKLSTKTEKIRARSLFELSKGDSIRKDTNRRLLKLQSEQEDLSEMTFKPQISQYAKSKKPTLDLSEEYTLKLKKVNEEKQKSIEKELEKRKEMEIEGCTFSPETRECPAYIKRIAKSLSIVKSARSSSQSVFSNNSKPDWR